MMPSYSILWRILARQFIQRVIPKIPRIWTATRPPQVTKSKIPLQLGWFFTLPELTTIWFKMFQILMPRLEYIHRLFRRCFHNCRKKYLMMAKRRLAFLYFKQEFGVLFLFQSTLFTVHLLYACPCM